MFDDISELVYIADRENYDLLYVNDIGRAEFHIDSLEGIKCYQAFQGLDKPCDFCNTKLLSEDKSYSWEHYNEKSGRYYLLKDRLIDWEGRKARMEIAFDLTEQREEKRQLENALDAEKMVMHCVEKLHQENDLAIGVHNMLRQLGQELQAERVYIFDVKDDRMWNTFEWCEQEVTPEIELLQAIDTTLLTRWRTYFDRGECIVIKDLEAIRELSPEEYEILSIQGIHSLVAAPLQHDGVLTGFIGVDNPPMEKIRNIAPLLNTLRYFVMATMNRIEDEIKLTELSYHDTLTGLLNRNAYTRDVEEIKMQKGSLGVLFADLNGLKEINDRGGHAMGDTALLKCAEHFRAAFPQAEHYRIGGDEFVVLQKDITQAQFWEQVKALRASFEKDSVYRMAVGAQWGEACAKVDEMTLAADTEMYMDKRRFYRSHAQSRRYRSFSDQDKITEENPAVKEYNMLMSAMHVSVSKHLIQPDFRLVWANDGFYELTGYGKEEHVELFHGSVEEYYKSLPMEFQRLQKTILEAFENGKSGCEAVLRLPQKGGKHIWINLVGTFTNEMIDGVPVIYAVFTDVTDLVQAQREQSVTYDNLPGFVAKMRISEDGRPHLVHANERFYRFFGAQKPGYPSELLLLNLRENWDVVQKHYTELRTGKPIGFEIKVRSIEGTDSYFQVFANCVDWNGDEPVYLVIYLDITESVAQRARFRELAFIDPITGGRNRESFQTDAGNAVAAAPAGSYVMISLDVQKFKVLNDLFGIDAGDKALRHIYNTLLQHITAGEFAARISADTFSLLLKADTEEKIEQRIVGMVEDINRFNNDNAAYKYYLTMCAGVYLVEDTVMPVTQLRDRSNVALKQAKQMTGTKLCTCRFYSNEDRLQLAREKDIENRMQDALDSEQFVVYLQPKQNLKTRKIVGAEALVRWKDPQSGLVPPNNFIPLFEKNGFIVNVDLFVFEFVCARVRSWIDVGLKPVPVSVNMSRAHLADPDFLQRYEKIREKYGVDPALLEIEVTETLVFENPELLGKVIDSIRNCGYRCSMDDFGSGYSSLNVLKNIRVDTLKLDRAFFSKESIDDPWEGAVVSVVVELAQKLGMMTVAEGVETEAQAEFLRGAGCDLLQGFLCSRPIPAEEFEALAFGSET